MFCSFVNVPNKMLSSSRCVILMFYVFMYRMTSSATCEQIYSTLKIDMDTAEKSKQWPFSCYVVAKEMKGSYSGLSQCSSQIFGLHLVEKMSSEKVLCWKILSFKALIEV